MKVVFNKPFYKIWLLIVITSFVSCKVKDIGPSANVQYVSLEELENMFVPYIIPTVIERNRIINIFQPPSDVNYGRAKWFGYGSDYFALLKEMPGINEFYFYGNAEDNSFPTERNGNDYETILLPTHSISNFIWQPLSYVEMTIKDSKGNVVFYLFDTKGGRHPASQVNARGNNHPDFSNRYLKCGEYQVTFSNISNEEITQVLEIQRLEGKNGYSNLFKDNVKKGETIVRSFFIENTGDEPNALFKINCNTVYP